MAWAKGQSGNPRGGQGKLPVTLEAKRFTQACREHSLDLLTRILTLSESCDDLKTLIQLADKVWDRAFGKPGSAPLTMPEAQRLDDSTPEQRVAILAKALEKARAEAEQTGVMQ